ncbi:Hsp70 nucleotide exchange factor (Fes1), putative [Cordyceps militaris CM01]|uniref:Hsp70 nucleotide exchange factor (Fes1), putative n=2 Tax=Cordyceps militaris TaxID=73501 RepID=G3JGJ8_CORMM|nr:Hsp70 nucleotide exchange factor (Fes1), putative [Cordyceps militaris CM01]ATY66715.1 Hsp70 nucleotide exchange factor (Fes1) [Cordyceps militaris]EGX92415.1 Hsp70 nucleotide exchange factor (Fes1), putative [Cordyceps militaris CM01]
MGDKRLNELLRWSIENTETEQPNGTGAVATTGEGASAAPVSNLTPEVMAALMGGPSDADLMIASMEIITAADVTLENKLIAFDNLEQLIESLDNANNLASLGLWTPLLAQLASPEAEIRTMAAWCIGTAVQNNEKTQERLFAVGGVPPLVALATSPDETDTVRRKAVYALSSAIRNYQPALDAAVVELVAAGHPADKVDAMDMEAVDTIITPLREKAMAAA